MFSKSSQVLGKSFLSAKESKSFRDILLTSHTVESIANLWIENSDLLLQQEERPNNSEHQNTHKLHAVKQLFLEWLGVPQYRNTAFTAEIVQGIVKGSENTKKLLLGVWSLKAESTPIAISVLPERISTSKLALPPPTSSSGEVDVALSLQSMIRLAQLWQLALAAAFVDAPQEEQATQEEKNNKKQNDDESAEDEESSDDDEESVTATAMLSSGLKNSSSTSVIFKLSSLLFHCAAGEQPHNREETKRILFKSLLLQRTQGADSLQLFPAVLCHTEVSDKIFRGSDLMAPGTFYQPRMVKYLTPGALTYLVPFGHYLPIAVGPLNEDLQFVAPSPATIDVETIRQAFIQKQVASEEKQIDEHAFIQQLKMLERKRLFSPHRATIASNATETKSIKITTSLGDFFWKSAEVGFAKSCSISKWSVFATSGGRLVNEEKTSLNLLMGHLVSLSTSTTTTTETSTAKKSQHSGSDTSKESEEEDEEAPSKNKSKKPMPKNKVKGISKTNNNKKKSGNNNTQAVAAQPQQQESHIDKKEKPHVTLLRWLLNECYPSPWPPGVVLSSPPKIIVPGENDRDSDNDDDDDDEHVDQQRNSKDLFSQNDPSAFASIVYKFASQLKNHSSSETVTTIGEKSESVLSAVTGGQQSLTEEILQAATFALLATISKDQLPLPLSQFGAKLQVHLPTNTSISLDWSQTKWKKPINFLRKYAKQKPGCNNSKNEAKGKKGNNNNKTQQQQEPPEIDLMIDWCVELVEQGPGNFEISSINKSSRIFRDHKKSTDAIHELVREESNHPRRSNNNNNSDDDDDNGQEYSQTQGKFVEIAVGYVSRRSGLSPELDVIVFGDPQIAQKFTAAATEAKEQAKFPTLGAALTEEKRPQNTVIDARGVVLDDFVSIDEAKRRVSQYARSCGFAVTKQDALPNSVTAASNAKPGDVKILGALKALYGNSPPLSTPLDDLMKKVAIQVQKGTLLRFQNGNSEIRKGNPPMLQLSAKQVHNHWVTSLTGQFGYYLDVNLASETIKRRLACSARVEDAPTTKGQAKNSLSLVLTGRHVEDLLNLLEEEFGVDQELVQLVNVAAAKKK